MKATSPVSKQEIPFGCQISEVNVIFGGNRGYSGGNLRIALKKPPSLARVNFKSTQIKRRSRIILSKISVHFE
jgi:hypothetical protein